jgi:hypothetical protein
MSYEAFMSAPKIAIYVETTIVSYITARPSRDPFLLGCQQLTRRWWRQDRGKFSLFTSQVVRDEAGRGEPLMAKRRSQVLKGISNLDFNDDADALAKAILKKAPIPAKAADDAFHIALAAVHGMNCLLSWNCRHISNIHTRRIVRGVCEKMGYQIPDLVTPFELQFLTFP